MLHVEDRGAVVLWTIDRPRAKNALDFETFGALVRAAEQARDTKSVRAVVLTGAGQVFVSGGDLRELREKTSAADAEHLSDLGWHLCELLAALPFPVVAALPGAAIGGGAELAIACDMRVADARATIAFKQARMGVTTAWGSVPRLLSLVSAGTAGRLLYAGHEMTAAEAKLEGLVDEVTHDGRAVEVALAWAADVAKASPAAVAGMKRILRAAVDRHDVRAIERRSFVDTWTGPDHLDAVDAYFEGRPPHWQTRG